MRWQGGRQSGNLEDRRRMSPTGVAAGGGGLLLIVLIMLCMGADPAKIQQLLQNPDLAPPGQQAGPGVERPETPQEARTREFAANILGYTEDVWGDLFRQAGEEYVPPKMVLFSKVTTTGCGTAPSKLGPSYCPADTEPE